MKLLAPLLLASVTVARSAWVAPNKGNQVAIKDEFNVPGENPLEFCGDPSSYNLDLESVDLYPNPPKA